MRFRVLHGKHREGGRTYVRGEIVDSATDLSKLNAPGAVKFEKLDVGSSGRSDFAARQREIQEAQARLDLDRAAHAAASVPEVPVQSAVAPGGQVSTGFQQTTSLPSGEPISGPVPNEEADAEARERAMGVRQRAERGHPVGPDARRVTSLPKGAPATAHADAPRTATGEAPPKVDAGPQGEGKTSNPQAKGK